MNLIGSTLYDPAVAVSKATSALLALTAFDTANLRLAITVPSHGKVRFKLRCTLTGATTCPVVLLGVLNGATVLARAAPSSAPVTAPAATQNFVLDAEFTVTGLAPGAMNVDAAYAVQVIVASTNIKYGGPNNASGANAWGGFLFEAWDPQPVPTATPGAANGLLIAGANAATTYATLTSTGAFSVNGVNAVSQTGDAFTRLGAPAGASVSADVAAVKVDTAAVKVQTDKMVFTVAGYLDSNAYKLAGQAITAAAGVTFPTSVASPTNITAGTITTVTNLTNAPTAGDLTATMKASVTTSATAATPTAAAVTGNVGGNVVGSVASVTADVGITQAAADKVWVSAARSLTSFGTLVADTATAVWGAVARTLTAGTNIVLAKGVGLTGLNDIAATAIVSAGAITTAGGKVSGVSLVDTLTTYTGNTPQTGDSYARVGAAGAGLTALGDVRIAHLDADVSSRSTFAGGAVASVTGNVGGDVVGSVASVTAPVSLTALYDPAKTAASQASVNAIPTAPLLAVNYTAPNNAGIASAAADAATAAAGTIAIYARTDVATSSRLSSGGYSAPDNAGIAAIKAVTDSLTVVAGVVDANVKSFNGVTLAGAGTTLNPWRGV